MRSAQDEVSSAIAHWRRACIDAPSKAVRIALDLDQPLLLRGPASLHRELLEKTLALPIVDRASLATRVDLLLSLGRADVIRGLYRTARAPFEEALRIARDLGDQAKEGWSSCFLAYALVHLERGEEAVTLAKRAIAFADDAGDARLRSIAEYVIGNLDLLDGRPADAMPWLLRALVSSRRAGGARPLGIALGNLAIAHRKGGQLVKARVLLAESRRMFERAGDLFHLGKVSVDAAILELDAGTARDAKALEAALASVIENGDIEGEIEAREALLRFAVRRKDGAAIVRRWEDLTILVRSTESSVWRARIEKLRPIASEPRLRVARDGRRIVVDARELDFGRRGPLRRILVELARHRIEGTKKPLAMSDLLALGWPHEKMRVTSGAARVYMAVRRLRSLGLESLVCTSDEGYFLDAGADVAWLEDDVRRR
jgi:tetratricopeptide (TPR) repeat protein